MSFESEKRRIDKIRNKQTEQQITADRLAAENNQTISQIIRLTPNHSVFKRRVDLSVDWQPMIQAAFLGEVSPDTQYINWEVVLERFDERWVPFLCVEILYRTSKGTIDDGVVIESPNKIVTFEIEDLPNETLFKKITVRASFYFSDGDVYLPYEAKLLVTLSNPQDNL